MILRVPNELKEEDVKEFQKIFKETHGTEISFEEAKELGMSLLRFMALVFQSNGKKI